MHYIWNFPLKELLYVHENVVLQIHSLESEVLTEELLDLSFYLTAPQLIGFQVQLIKTWVMKITNSLSSLLNSIFKCHWGIIYQLNYGIENNRLLFFFLASRLENAKKL